MPVDENNAYRITERLAFPRLVGSEAEIKARDVVFDEFKNAGYDEVYRDSFKTSMYNWRLTRYIFMPLGVSLILLGLSFYFSNLLTLGLIVLIVIIITRMLGVVNASDIKLSGKEKYNFDTENFYVKLKANNPKATVVFLGHWDSKSQTFPAAIRVAVISIAVFGTMLLVFLYLILTVVKIVNPFNLPLLNDILFYSCIIIAIIGVLNYFNRTGNTSPGAIDNAASVGTVIELARYFKENPLNNIDFVFLSPGSEELNLGGAKHFIATHKREFDPKSTYFINFDGIGGTGLIRLITAYGIPRKTSSKKLNDLLLASSKELNIDAKAIYLPTGAWSDFMPIIQQGFEACWLASQGGLKYVHTPRDNMKIVSREGLKKGLLLSVAVAEKLNEE